MKKFFTIEGIFVLVVLAGLFYILDTDSQTTSPINPTYLLHKETIPNPHIIEPLKNKTHIYYIKPILQQTVGGSRFFCMHQVKHDELKSYRVCLFDKKYITINPNLEKIELLHTQSIVEKSIMCKQERQRQRAECIYLFWFDEVDWENPFRKRVCGNTSYIIQKTMDEFEGNKYC